MSGKSDDDVDLVSLAQALFDADLYYRKYSDVRFAKLDAFEHYMTYGWREGRVASDTFDSGYYSEAHSDVAAGNLNPLMHYASFGVFEDRATMRAPSRNPGKDVVLSAVSVPEEVVLGSRVKESRHPLTAARIRACLKAALRSSNRRVVVSLSHDEYLVCVGGVQNVVAAEAASLVASGCVYLHLSPAPPLPMLANEAALSQTSFALTMNGHREGTVLLSDLLPSLHRLVAEASGCRLVIHHLMGFAIDTVLKLAKVCGAGPVYVWIHDFFTLCVNPFLQRNNHTFCGSPSVESVGCMVCNNGDARRQHIASMRVLFDTVRPVVLTPSTTALEFWRARGGLAHAAAKVIPPAGIDFGPPVVATRGDPLRIAHLGAPAPHKGWATFEKLLAYHFDDERYRFYRLGAGVVGTHGLEEVAVQVTPDNPNAMIDAVRAQNIDVVINWSSCYETFSFVTLEAMAGGAFVLARRGAGHVWPAVADAGAHRGVALSTEMELRALLASGEILRLCPPSRTYGQLLRSQGAAVVLRQELGVA
jgi:hypothetical protein